MEAAVSRRGGRSYSRKRSSITVPDIYFLRFLMIINPEMAKTRSIKPVGPVLGIGLRSGVEVAAGVSVGTGVGVLVGNGVLVGIGVGVGSSEIKRV